MLVKSQIKYIQSLGQKKYRDEAGLFIAEGNKLVNECLAEIPSHVLQVYATEKWITSNPAKKPDGLIMVTESEMERISQLTTPGPVLAVVKKMVMPVSLEWNENIILALDTIQDPGNLGTIIRIADWFGVGQIVCSHDCADLYNPKVVQATMGSLTRVKVIYTDIAALLAAEDGIIVYGAVLDGQDITTIPKPVKGIIVIGNEARGISENVLQLVNRKITISRKGRAESLNAAVATGIILSHVG